MDKRICIVHANCQGEPLVRRLTACPEFAAEYECILFTNYAREPIPGETLEQCSLFLYQYLGPGWDDLASERLLHSLPASAKSLCIPNMFFKGYWPMWTGKSGFDYRCSHLDEIIDKGLPPEETTMLFLHSDIAARHDLSALLQETIERERERERHTPVKYLDLLIKKHGKQRLFNTVNHPRAILLDHAAKGTLTELGFEPPDDAVLNAMGEPFPEFELPINPKVSRFFGWDFGGPDAEYEIYGRKMTFARYTANYIIARRAGVEDFIGFLQGASIAI